MFRNLLIRLLAPLTLTLAVLSSGLWYYYGKAINTPLVFGNDILHIRSGETLTALARRLMESGILPEPWSLRILARMEGDRPIIAGEYDLPQSMTLVDFLDHIVTGVGQVDMRVTVIEGWTFQQMRTTLGMADGLRRDTGDWHHDRIMAELGHPELHPEGQFFPDTYHYRRGDSDFTIYRKAFRLMQDRLQEVWGNRSPDLPLKDPYEVLILASIVEKETQDHREQPTIAGVFYNRLRKGMRLQTDPTVIYGLGEAYDGNITRKHLRTDTPYNTYTRKGLTPTPISLPGMSSLMAVVQPMETEALYFVSRGDGQHHFSRTLEEHNRAVRKYILSKQ